MIQILEFFTAIGLVVAAVMLWIGFRPMRVGMAVDLGNEKHQRLEKQSRALGLVGKANTWFRAIVAVGT